MLSSKSISKADESIQNEVLPIFGNEGLLGSKSEQHCTFWMKIAESC